LLAFLSDAGLTDAPLGVDAIPLLLALSVKLT
jgi:hypothetical protein